MVSKPDDIALEAETLKRSIRPARLVSISQFLSMKVNFPGMWAGCGSVRLRTTAALA